MAGGAHAGARQWFRQSHGWRQFRLQLAPHDGTRAHGCSCASLQTDVPPEEEMCRKKVTGACESMQATPALALYPWQCRLLPRVHAAKGDALSWQAGKKCLGAIDVIR